MKKLQHKRLIMQLALQLASGGTKTIVNVLNKNIGKRGIAELIEFLEEMRADHHRALQRIGLDYLTAESYGDVIMRLSVLEAKSQCPFARFITEELDEFIAKLDESLTWNDVWYDVLAV